MHWLLTHVSLYPSLAFLVHSISTTRVNHRSLRVRNALRAHFSGLFSITWTVENFDLLKHLSNICKPFRFGHMVLIGIPYVCILSVEP